MNLLLTNPTDDVDDLVLNISIINSLFSNTDVLLNYYHVACFGLVIIIRHFLDSKLYQYLLLNCLCDGSFVVILVMLI
jgi:hypothetical protein